MSKIIPFAFDNHQVRVITGENGEPEFVGKDVCDVLGYADHVNAMKQHCRGVVKRHPIADALSRMQETRMLTEPDMMRLVVNSHLPSAQAFESLVFDTILPTIRKTGSYLPPGATLDSLPPALATQIGGIIKAVVHKQLETILQLELPRLLQSELARQRLCLRAGVTAGQVWSAHGLPPLKNGSQFLSRCLVNAGCGAEGGGRGELGRNKALMFDPDKAARVMKDGLLEHCKKYYAERKGQGLLFAIKK